MSHNPYCLFSFLNNSFPVFARRQWLSTRAALPEQGGMQRIKQCGNRWVCTGTRGSVLFPMRRKFHTFL
jgi:hypothetical protein